MTNEAVAQIVARLEANAMHTREGDIIAQYIVNLYDEWYATPITTRDEELHPHKQWQQIKRSLTESEQDYVMNEVYSGSRLLTVTELRAR